MANAISDIIERARIRCQVSHAEGNGGFRNCPNPKCRDLTVLLTEITDLRARLEAAERCIESDHLERIEQQLDVDYWRTLAERRGRALVELLGFAEWIIDGYERDAVHSTLPGAPMYQAIAKAKSHVVDARAALADPPARAGRA